MGSCLLLPSAATIYESYGKVKKYFSLITIISLFSLCSNDITPITLVSYQKRPMAASVSVPEYTHGLWWPLCLDQLSRLCQYRGPGTCRNWMPLVKCSLNPQQTDACNYLLKFSADIFSVYGFLSFMVFLFMNLLLMFQITLVVPEVIASFIVSLWSEINLPVLTYHSEFLDAASYDAVHFLWSSDF